MTTAGIVEWFVSQGGSYDWENADESTVRAIILDIQAKKGNEQSGKFLRSGKGGINKILDVGQSTIENYVQKYEAKTVQPILREIESATEVEQVNKAVRQARTLKIPDKIRKEATAKRAAIMERQRKETLEQFRLQKQREDEERNKRLAEIARREGEQ